MKRFLLAVAALLAVATAAPAAQVPSVTGPQDPSQLNATINTVIGNINAALGTYAKDPASSTYYPAYTFTNSQTLLAFNGSGTTTTYAYVTLPAVPVDGQQSCLYSRAAITTLYVYVQGTQTINNAVTTLAAAGKVCYTYSLANTTWDRSQ